MGPMASVGASITGCFDDVFARLTVRLAGLSDDEYLWEPVAGCWSVRRGADGRLAIDGGGGGGPAPDPAPFTTIAWRIGHIALSLGGFADALFGEGTLDVADLDYPAGGDGVGPFLEGHWRSWRDGLGGVEGDEWWRPIGARFGPYCDDSVADLALHVLDELVHHAGEVGVLRDLYAHRRELGGA